MDTKVSDEEIDLSCRLLDAVRDNNVEKAQRLIVAGADVNERDPVSNIWQTDHLEAYLLVCLPVVLDWVTNLFMGALISQLNGATCLMYSCCTPESMPMTRLLLDSCADPFASLSNGANALTSAMKQGQRQVAELLLERGVDIFAAFHSVIVSLNMTFIMNHSINQSMTHEWSELMLLLFLQTTQMQCSHELFIIPTEFQSHPLSWMLIESVMSGRYLLLAMLISNHEELCRAIAPCIRHKAVNNTFHHSMICI
jgi:hypothetical protein